jgi:predicted metalloprotease
MRWQSGRRSTNVEDRRGSSPSHAMGAGGAVMLLRILPWLLRSKGGRFVLVIGVAVFFGARLLGIDLMPLLTGGGSPQVAERKPIPAEQQELVDFVSVVLADTETTWHGLFKTKGLTYKEPVLVLFSGSVSSACGMGQAAMGPFYCPADQKLYIDLTFYRDLKTRHQAPGDFAQAYVIAHEVGHHVQTLLGISGKVHAARQKLSEKEANLLSVKQELQADCFAGVWGHHANTQREMLESGDLEEALVAASAIGDDRLQKQGRGHVTPDSFTHGSSEQRMRWFKTGFASGSPDVCDTFGASGL